MSREIKFRVWDTKEHVDGKRIIEWSDAGCWCASTLLLAKLIPWIKVIGNIHEDGQPLEADK